MTRPRDYALYRGDELLGIGTVKELAEQFGVSENTIRHYGSKVYASRAKKPQNRKLLVAIEDDDEEV